MTVVRNTPLLMIFIFMAVAAPQLGINFKSVEDPERRRLDVSAFFFRSASR